MQDDTAYGISFISLPGMEAIEVIDPIERYRYRLETPEDVMPVSVDTERFLFPVDRAVVVETSEIKLPRIVTTVVRTRDGNAVTEVDERGEHRSLPVGNYVIELCTPVKIYLELSSNIDINSDSEMMSFDFGKKVEVAVGARSWHKRPEASITTTTDITDIMRTVSMFGSALKTTTPERSFPTLRGHPPRVNLGDELDVPAGLAPPDTGIRLSLQPSIETVFTSASLAYYLGAKVVPDNSNALYIDDELVRSFGVGESFADAIEETLKHIFLLDCVVRTEGLYPVDLDEREQVEKRTDIDIGEVYDLPLSERLRRYLSIPYNIIGDIVPRWGNAAHVEANKQHVELLPYVVDDLALVHVHDPTEIDRPSSPMGVVESEPSEATAFSRSGSTSAMENSQFVRPPRTDCVDQVWIGDGTPIGANKAIPAAFEHRLERTPTSSNIDITVVCNDDRMNDERGLIDDIYGSRDDIEFSVSTHRNLTCDELIEVLNDGGDFLHYIGHIDDNGFWCVDGKLDLADVDGIDVSTFLLNACQSYRQGRHLIEQGGIGGIVTLSDVINEGAVRIGHTLAQLLNMGFPLYSALGIAKQESPMGTRYGIIGDGRVSLTQAQSVPCLNKITRSGDGVTLEAITYPNSRFDLGSMIYPTVSQNERYFLVSQNIQFKSLDMTDFKTFLKTENMPVKLDGELIWSKEMDFD